MLAYKAIEDNAGGLHLFVFDGKDDNGTDQVIYAHSGYECHQGQLCDDIQSLKCGSHPSDWSGNNDNPKKDFDYLYAANECHVIAAREYRGLSEIYPDMMGQAALIEFGIKTYSV